jgi:pyruvate,water dikinase
MKYIIPFREITEKNQDLVGGKNASLGHMIRDLIDKVSIPNGFAITTEAYWYLLRSQGLVEKIEDRLNKIDIHKNVSLKEEAHAIRSMILKATVPEDLKTEILTAYHALSTAYDGKEIAVAVRSSASAEDSPEASFAGQQESFLYISGDQLLLETIKKCMASLFTDRSIVYRVEKGFRHMDVALSVGVQKMVHADTGVAGVAFSLDTDTGFKDVVLINGSWGLGETIVQGAVTPDEFVVYKPQVDDYVPIIKKRLGAKRIKMVYERETQLTRTVKTSQKEQDVFCLSDKEIMQLARYVVLIEKYYTEKNGRWMPQDIEWAKDGQDGKIYIVQARPETIHATEDLSIKSFCVAKNHEKSHDVLIEGISIGQKIVSGKAHVITSVTDIDQVKKGDIIVTEMTDPDWVPAMKKAGGIITDRGGRTCHAAIVSRELGIPAIVGTCNGTQTIKTGDLVTIDCSQGAVGYVYAGEIPFKTTCIALDSIPKLSSKIFVNIADPDRAFAVSQLPVEGVGLARLEFILNNQIGIHPMAIVQPDAVTSEVRKIIEHKAAAYDSPKEYFVQTLAQNIGMIAAAFHPHEVIVRLSDFKSNEYRSMIGGAAFEPIEDNPMIGWRGASRYYHPQFSPAFKLECEAFVRVRSHMGFKNVRIMVPFVRTIDEAKHVIELLAQNGLERGKDGLEIIMMCEVPSNILLIEQFAPLFDGFSIGSNDLTQLILGIDRDSTLLSPLFSERDPAVQLMCRMAIEGAHAKGLPIGICGQGPSDYLDWANMLIKQGIDYISLNADAVISFLQQVGKK